MDMIDRASKYMLTTDSPAGDKNIQWLDTSLCEILIFSFTLRALTSALVRLNLPPRIC